jgi:hypothetical protein
VKTQIAVVNSRLFPISLSALLLSVIGFVCCFSIGRQALADDPAATSSTDFATCPSVLSVRQSVYLIENEEGSVGTAFVFKDRRHLATAWHVISAGVPAVAMSITGKKTNFEVVAKDEVNDLAILRVKIDLEGEPLLPATAVNVGMPAFSIGHPAAGWQNFEKPLMKGILRWTISAGIVTQVGERMVQTDTAILGGNAGGPLVSCSGKLLGVLIYDFGPGVAATVGSEWLKKLATEPERSIERYRITTFLDASFMFDLRERGYGLSFGWTKFVGHLGLRLGVRVGSNSSVDYPTDRKERSAISTTFVYKGFWPKAHISISAFVGSAYVMKRQSELFIGDRTGQLINRVNDFSGFAGTAGMNFDYRHNRFGFVAEIPFSGDLTDNSYLALVGWVF